MRETYMLFSAFSRNNWRMILISTIGLTLALTSISQTVIIVESYRTSLLDEFLENSPFYLNSDFRVDFDFDSLQGTEVIRSSIQDAFNEIRGLGQRVAEDLSLNNFIKQEFWNFRFKAVGFFERGILPVFVDTMDNETLQTFQSMVFGRLPQKTNEYVFIKSSIVSREFDMEIGDTLSVFPREYSNIHSESQNVTISGIINFDEEQVIYYSNEKNPIFDYFLLSYGDPILLTTTANFVDIATRIHQTETLPFSVHGQINLDTSQFDAFNLAGEKTRLIQYQNQLDQVCTSLELGDYDFKTDESIISRIESFEVEFQSTLLNLLLFSLPTNIATLFLAMFSLGLLRKRKHLQIGVLKARGASPHQIFMVLIGESFITMFLSVGLGTLLGFPFALVTLKTKDFLTFSGETVIPILSETTFSTVLLFGILFVIILNLRSILQLVKMEIKETVYSRTNEQPVWKKYYLDGVLFGLGVLGVFSILVITSLLGGVALPIGSSSGGASAAIIDVINMISFFIVLLFGIPSPILITVGGAMLIARILPFLLQLFSRWTWKLEGGIVAFSFRNVLQRTSQATRAALLVSVVLAFSIAFITIPYNLDANALDRYSYRQLGSDILVSSPTLTLNETFLNYLQDFTGVNSVSPIAKALVRSPTGYLIKILGVDSSTYAQTTFFREDFLKQDLLSSLGRLDLAAIFRSLISGEIASNSPDLGTLLSTLQSNTSVLVQEANINGRNLNIGDQLKFDVEGSFNETTLNFDIFHFDLDIVGSFKYWPLFVDYTVAPTNLDLFIIFELSALLDYVNADMISLNELNYLVRVNPGVSTAQIKEQIMNDPGFNVLCIEEFQEGYFSSPQRTVLLAAINGSILILMTVTLFTILMFGFSQLMERNKEIGVERALGMSIRQTFLVFLTETMILTLFGTIVGLILGILIGQVFLAITLGVQTFIAPLPIITYPWELLFGISLLVIIVGLISSQIPAFLATRVRISYILRGE
ncbi:MAG: FtsX-like permease family protein [Promethearchaeota archaeon]